MESVKPTCFKAYDIRGRVPEELNPELAYNIGRAFFAVYGVSKVVLGHDMRLSSESLIDALAQGLTDVGVDVIHLGLCGTEEIYHATFSLEKDGVDGGIIVTASHNPADYNGLKFVVKGAQPVTGTSGLDEMGRLIAQNELPAMNDKKGMVTQIDHKAEYVSHLLGYINTDGLKPLKLVVNSGNGCAGKTVDQLGESLPFDFVKIHHEPDGTFPNGVPNPLLHENRQETTDAILDSGADLGIAWDGDFDRCFFWDEKGEFIEGYYIVGLLAQELLQANPGSKIIHDPRLLWSTREIVQESGGEPVICQTGHALIKEKMRAVDALYGGEMSAHHYFKDFAYCDSGMIPWLLVCSLISRSGKKMSELVAERVAAYPVSGEINNRVEDPDAVIETIKAKYQDGEIDLIDGLSISFPEYRFNIRKSNTEPLLRLNVESRGDAKLLKEKTKEILSYIK